MRYRLARVFGVTPLAIDLWDEAGRLRPRVDHLGVRRYTPDAVWQFVVRFRDRDGEPRMDPLRRAIFTLYRAEPTLFEKGCGRRTMARWIREYTGLIFEPRAIRAALDEIAEMDLFVKGRSDVGYTTYRWAEDT